MSEPVVAITLIAGYAGINCDYTQDHSESSVAGSEFARYPCRREISGLKQLSQPISTAVLNPIHDTLRILSYLI